jgi:GTP-binding protein Era
MARIGSSAVPVGENWPVTSPSDGLPADPTHGAAFALDGFSHREGFRSGFACFIGRPNVGKSTLMNALVGTKVAITSSQPQTTRRAVRGIVHRPDAQLIIVDTPGLHKPRTLLGERLDSLVRSTLTEVDVIGFCVPANEPVGPGDRFIARELERVRQTPVVAVVTKADLAGRKQIADQLLEVGDLGEWADIVPVSALARPKEGGARHQEAPQAGGAGGAGGGGEAADQVGFQLDILTGLLIDKLPEGMPLYPEGELTDEPEQLLAAELIREAALEGVRDELPHSIAVVVEEMSPRAGRDDLIDVYAQLFVERPSQKAIVIGAKGARLRDVGTQARKQIEALLGARVFLDLRVKVAKDWQRDPKQLRRLGFYD